MRNLHGQRAMCPNRVASDWRRNDIGAAMILSPRRRYDGDGEALPMGHERASRIFGKGLTRIEQRLGKAPLRRANHNIPTNWPIMITAIATTSILS